MNIMVSRTLSVHQEHELLLKLEVAGLTDELAQRVIAAKGNVLASRIVQLISGDERQRVPVPGSRLVKTLTVTCEGNQLASELRQRGQYDGSNALITDDRFPITAHAPIQRQIDLLELEHDWSWDEGLAALAASNLDRPTHEDALYFGIYHPQEQRKQPIVFPHEPVRGPRGCPNVLVLRGYAVHRELGLVYCDHGWALVGLIAGVRKVA